MKKKLFCSTCQVETDQNFEMARNVAGQLDLVASCPCGRHVKFSGDLTPNQLIAAMAIHATDNIGQVPPEDASVLANHPLLEALARL